MDLTTHARSYQINQINYHIIILREWVFLLIIAIPSHRKHFHFQTILFKNAVLEWIIKHIFFYINIRYFYISRGGVFRIINLLIFDTPGDFQSLISIWPSIITYFANCRSVAFGRKKLDTYDMGANIDTYMLKYWYLQLQTKTCVSFELIKLISIHSLYNLLVPLNFSDNLQLISLLAWGFLFITLIDLGKRRI